MKKWYNMAVSTKGDTADIYIYEPIGWFGITSSQFIADLMVLGDIKKLNIHISCVGGEVWDGMAIYNTLLQHPAKKHSIIEGVAASMGSVVALAGDKISMYETSLFMIHKPWSIAIGDSKEMEKTAEILNKIQEAISNAYVSKTNKSVDDINELIDEESWMTAENAKEDGFIDKIIKRSDDQKVKDAENIKNRIVEARDLVEKFKNVPQKIAAMVQDLPPRETPAAGPDQMKAENVKLKNSLKSSHEMINILSKL